VISEPVRFASVERARYVARAAVFAFGVASGAASLGALLGFVGSVTLRSHGLGVALTAAAMATLVIARELGGAPVFVPQRRWQVPREWLRNRFWMGAFAFGAVMGAGIFTFIPSLVFYLYLLACLLIGSTGYGALLGLFYGLSFAGTVFLRGAMRRPESPADYADRGLATGARARVIGALAAPLVISLPLAWPF
jgi:hypothetical protein